jgi:hypothetical protein
MKSVWTDNLKTDEEKQRFKNSVLASSSVLERLDEILLKMQDDQDGIERNTKIYDMPNWDYRQAHLNGFKDCLHKVRFLINLDQGK